MCGINGFTFSDHDTALAMNQATCHRGPDATALWEGQGITFGHNRLAIIDLSPRGSQPMWDANKEIVIVFNGEIYNFKELRVELAKKYQFNSQSDTEVILYAYKEYGPECVKKLNGIFAFAIWDNRAKELFLARDHQGVIPLYYTETTKGLIFSSEIKAILEHNSVERLVDEEAFNLYFQLLYTPEPLTMFKGIYKLPAASYLVWKDGKYTIKKYWEVTDFNDETNYSLTKIKIKSLFEDAVKHQLIADRPVGVFLSGGIDSTAVLGAATQFHQGQINTFSVGFKDSLNAVKFNADFSLAKKTADFYQTNHHELMLGAADIRDNLENIVWHLDEPSSNPTAGAMFLLSKMAKQDVAVVLGGDGGDELFGGYPRYYFSKWISKFKSLPSVLQKLILLGVSRDTRAKFQIKTGPEQILTFLAQRPSTVTTVLSKNIYVPQVSQNYLQNTFFSNNQITDFEKYFMNVDRQSWLVDESLLRTNKMSLAFGLETRVPILDYRLVELSQKIPTAWKFSILKNRPSVFQGKDIWRDAVQAYLPPHILNQPKRGWFTPMAKWLRQPELRDYISEILSPGRLDSNYFNVPGVQKMWQDHLDSRTYNLPMIWAIVMWQLWYEQFIKR